MRYVLFLSILMLFSSCFKGKSVDLIVHNAKIHTMDDNNTIGEAMAIDHGKIIEVGPERQILNKYTAEEEIDAGGKDVYPGFTDAHAHMLLYAKQKLNADLSGSKSFDEVLVRLEKYQQRNNRKFIVGQGWDQSLWDVDSLPDNTRLNELFPSVPVCIYRVDGHALLANDACMKKAGISSGRKIEGGFVDVKNGKCTGILADNAMNPVSALIPPYSKADLSRSLLEIQEELFQYGITGVHEAGIEYDDIDLFRSLIDKNQFHLNIYAMLMPTEANFAFAKKHGKYHYRNLNIRSFKVFGDGSLGSRGACLKQPYSDDPGNYGTLTTSIQEMKRIATVCELRGYQMNVHAIGDSTVKVALQIFKELNDYNKDHRSRMEHAQVVDPADFHLFSDYGVFPSVQPTHAVSDQRWVEQRIGKKRMKGAYAYRTLLDTYGMLAIGTDFPVEQIDPFRTLFAAVARKNEENIPGGGFYPEQAITLDECIKGMTIWAAYAAFQEATTGSLEKGKQATFAIFERPVRIQSEYKPNFAAYTFINGKKVYSIE